MATLQLLGTVELTDDNGKELINSLPGRPKRFALLAYLGGNAPQRFHRRDRLLSLFWPESAPDQARHALRQSLYEIRNQLGADVFVRRGADEIGINEDVLTCDVSLFDAALKRQDWDRAVELYRGDFLDGFFVSEPEVEEWIETRRATLKKRVLDAHTHVIDACEDRGDIANAVAAAERAVLMSPLDEVTVRRLLMLLEREGNVGAAIRAYDRLTRALTKQFDAQPSIETTALISTIRKSRSSEADNQSFAEKVLTDRSSRPHGARAQQISANDTDSNQNFVGVANTESNPPSNNTGRRRFVALVVGTAIAIALLAYRTIARIKPSIDDVPLVAVAPFTNESQDPNLDIYGRWAAASVAFGLQYTRGRILPTSTTFFLYRRLSEDGSGSQDVSLDEFADETGADIVITGRFYKAPESDSVQVFVNVNDRRKGMTSHTISMTYLLASMHAALSDLQQRVMGGIEYARFSRDTPRAPPLFIAYKAFETGLVAFENGDLRSALAGFLRAHELDQKFVSPLMAAAFMYANLGDSKSAYALTKRLTDEHESDLPLSEYLIVGSQRAAFEGRDKEGLELARRAAKIAPFSMSHLQQAHYAGLVNRPHEALASLRDFREEVVPPGGAILYTMTLTTGNHRVENHESELRALRSYQQRHPTRSIFAIKWFARALAGLRDHRALDSLVNAIGPSYPAIGDVLYTIWTEQAFHGDDQGALRFANRHVAWFESSPEDISDVGSLHHYANALAFTERLDNAYAVLRSIGPDNMIDQHSSLTSFENRQSSYRLRRSSLAQVAALQGDSSTAETIISELEDARNPSSGVDWIIVAEQAKVALALGDCARATRLAQRARAASFDSPDYLHTQLFAIARLDCQGFKNAWAPETN